MKQLTVTLPEALGRKFEDWLEQNPQNPDEVVRIALEHFLEGQTSHLPAYLDANDPRAILQLPKEQRQARLQQQAEHAQPLYALGSSLTEWTEEFVEDEDDADIAILGGIKQLTVTLPEALGRKFEY